MEMNISFYLNLLSDSPPLWATLIAAAFVLTALALSFYLVFDRLSSHKHPEEQKFLLGVILLVPAYAVESFVLLVYPSVGVDVEILHDCYESFACMGGEERTIEFMERQGRASSKTPLLQNSSDRNCEASFSNELRFKTLETWTMVLPNYQSWHYPICADVHCFCCASANCPPETEEVRDSERPTKLRLPQPDLDIISQMTIKESVRDVLIGGRGYTEISTITDPAN